ncbi:MAG: class I SAM-dependent methyltransferase [Bacteroidota bacterium]
MNDLLIADAPKHYASLCAKSEEMGFSMASDLHIGVLLRTLIASKPKANLLELGTGAGLSLVWMIDGMDAESQITTIDNDPDLTAIAKDFFGDNKQVKIICTDGSAWLKAYKGESFDLIFADAWPGKYSDIEKTLDLVKVGGYYLIDDMRTQPNWPEGHQEKVDQLIAYLEQREDFYLTKMDWSTGIILATKRY